MCGGFNSGATGLKDNVIAYHRAPFLQAALLCVQLPRPSTMKSNSYVSKCKSPMKARIHESALQDMGAHPSDKDPIEDARALEFLLPWQKPLVAVIGSGFRVWGNHFLLQEVASLSQVKGFKGQGGSS